MFKKKKDTNRRRHFFWTNKHAPLHYAITSFIHSSLVTPWSAAYLHLGKSFVLNLSQIRTNQSNNCVSRINKQPWTHHVAEVADLSEPENTPHAYIHYEVFIFQCKEIFKYRYEHLDSNTGADIFEPRKHKHNNKLNFYEFLNVD